MRNSMLYPSRFMEWPKTSSEEKCKIVCVKAEVIVRRHNCRTSLSDETKPVEWTATEHVRGERPKLELPNNSNKMRLKRRHLYDES